MNSFGNYNWPAWTRSPVVRAGFYWQARLAVCKMTAMIFRALKIAALCIVVCIVVLAGLVGVVGLAIFAHMLWKTWNGWPPASVWGAFT